MQKIRDFPVLPRWMLFITWGVIIIWLSLTPSLPEIDAGLLGWDKFQHALAFGLFTMLAGQAFIRFSPDRKKRWGRAVMVTAVFGCLLEVAQGVFTKTRTAEFGDWLADLVGALFVYAVAMVTAFYRNRTKRT